MEPESDFGFYLKFAKPLVLSLPETNDRVLAAAWVKRLIEDPATEGVKTDYIKLLLFVLQKKRLVGPFNAHPSSFETLENISATSNLLEVAKDVIEMDLKETEEKLRKRLSGESGDFPTYTSDFSADLLEYVAVQEIPNFGVHCYYAISKQPLSTWDKVDKSLLPKAAKSTIEVAIPPPSLSVSASSPTIGKKSPTRRSPERTAGDSTPEPKTSKKKSKKSTLGASPPSPVLGKISAREERTPPTWGSNLLGVKEPLDEIGGRDVSPLRTPKFKGGDESPGLPSLPSSASPSPGFDVARNYPKKTPSPSSRQQVSPTGRRAPFRSSQPGAPVEEEPEYDMEALEELGLNASDLAEINLDDLDLDLDDINVDGDDYAPDDYQTDIDQQMDEYEKMLQELERENAEDIALYGDMSSGHLQSPYRSPATSPTYGNRSPEGPQSFYRSPVTSPGYENRSPKDPQSPYRSPAKAPGYGNISPEHPQSPYRSPVKSPLPDPMAPKKKGSGRTLIQAPKRLPGIPSRRPRPSRPERPQFPSGIKRPAAIPKAIKRPSKILGPDPVAGRDAVLVSRDAKDVMKQAASIGQKPKLVRPKSTKRILTATVASSQDQNSMRRTTSPDRYPDDFEQAEEMIRKEMIAAGQDPNARSSQTRDAGVAAFYDAAQVMSRAAAQYQGLEDANVLTAVPKDFDSSLEQLEEMLEHQMRQEGQGPGKEQGLSDMHHVMAKADRQHRSSRSPERASPQSEDDYDKELNTLIKLQELYEKHQPNVRGDVERTPPMFSKYQEIREAARDLRYRPEEFELDPNTQWQSGPEFFAQQPIPAINLMSDDVSDNLEDVEAPEDFMNVSFSPRDTGIDQLKAILKQEEDFLRSSPALGGSPVTAPKPTPIPSRPRNTDRLILGTSPPLFPESPETEEPKYLSPELQSPQEFEENLSSSPSPRRLREEILAQPPPQFNTPYSGTVGANRRVVARRSQGPEMSPLEEFPDYYNYDDAEMIRNVRASSGLIERRPMHVSSTRGGPTRELERRSRRPQLPNLTENIDWTDSPVSSRPFDENQWKRPPKRRQVRRKLSKRRLDFTQPCSPNEQKIETQEVETDILEDGYQNQSQSLQERRSPPQYFQQPRTTRGDYVRPLKYVSPPDFDVLPDSPPSPDQRSPKQYLERSPRTPEVVNLANETMPEFGESPPSPRTPSPRTPSPRTPSQRLPSPPSRKGRTRSEQQTEEDLEFEELSEFERLENEMQDSGGSTGVCPAYRSKTPSPSDARRLAQAQYESLLRESPSPRPRPPPRSPSPSPKTLRAEILAQPPPQFQKPYRKAIGANRTLVTRRSRGPEMSPLQEFPDHYDYDQAEMMKNVRASSGQIERRPMRVSSTRGGLTRELQRRSQRPQLPEVTEHIDLTDSPVSSRPIDARQWKRPANRRQVRRKLPKRRIDFTQPSPNEQEIETHQVETGHQDQLQRRSPPQYLPQSPATPGRCGCPLKYETPPDFDTLPDSSPSPDIGEDPRSPGRYLERSARTPEMVNLANESMPEFGKSPSRTPSPARRQPSPVSPTIQRIKEAPGKFERRNMELYGYGERPAKPLPNLYKSYYDERGGPPPAIEEYVILEAMEKLRDETLREIEEKIQEQTSSRQPQQFDQAQVTPSPRSSPPPSPFLPENETVTEDMFVEMEGPPQFPQSPPTPPLSPASAAFPLDNLFEEGEESKMLALGREGPPPCWASPPSPIRSDDIYQLADAQYASLLPGGGRRHQTSRSRQKSPMPSRVERRSPTGEDLEFEELENLCEFENLEKQMQDFEGGGVCPAYRSNTPSPSDARRLAQAQYESLLRESPSPRPRPPPTSPSPSPQRLRAEILAQPPPQFQNPYRRAVGANRTVVARRSQGPEMSPLQEFPDHYDYDQAEMMRNVRASSGQIERRPMRVSSTRGGPTRELQRRSQRPQLPELTEHIDLTDSPVSSRPFDENQWKRPPNRRQVRRLLTKRRIDFTQPCSPNERKIERQQIESDIVEDGYQTPQQLRSPSQYIQRSRTTRDDYVTPLRYVSPPDFDYSPPSPDHAEDGRSPRRHLDKSPRTPEMVNLENEMMPEFGESPRTPSPANRREREVVTRSRSRTEEDLEFEELEKLCEIENFEASRGASPAYRSDMSSPSNARRLAQDQYESLLRSPSPKRAPRELEIEYNERVAKGRPGVALSPLQTASVLPPTDGEEPVMYDVEALRELGLTEADLEDLDKVKSPSSKRRTKQLVSRSSPASPTGSPREVTQFLKQMEGVSSQIHKTPMIVQGKLLPYKYKFRYQKLGKVSESPEAFHLISHDEATGGVNEETPPWSPQANSEEVYERIMETSPPHFSRTPPRHQSTTSQNLISSPSHLREVLNAHEYTQQFYDKERNLMTKRLQIGNKAKELRGSEAPRLRRILDMPQTQLPPVRQLINLRQSPPWDRSRSGLINIPSPAGRSPPVSQQINNGPEGNQTVLRCRPGQTETIETEETREELRPFGGRTSPGASDTSPIQNCWDDIPEDLQNFKWMDQ